MILKYFAPLLLAVGALLSSPCLGSAPMASMTDFHNEGALRAVCEHLSAVRSGDLRHAWHELSSPEFREATPFTAFSELTNKVPEVRSFQNIQLDNMTFTIEGALVQTTLVDEESSPIATVHYHMIRHGGRWVVQGMAANTELPPVPQSPVKEKKVLQRPYLLHS